MSTTALTLHRWGVGQLPAWDEANETPCGPWGEGRRRTELVPVGHLPLGIGAMMWEAPVTWGGHMGGHEGCSGDGESSEGGRPR